MSESLQQSLITFEWCLLLDIVFSLNLEDCWKTGISFEVNCLYMVFPSELLDFQSFHSVVLTFPLSPVTWLAFIHGVRLGKSRLYLRLQFLLKLGGAQCLFWGLICQSLFLVVTIWQEPHTNLVWILWTVNALSYVNSPVTIMVGLSWLIMADVREASDCCEPQSLCSGWSLLYPVTGYGLGTRSFWCKDETQEYLLITS